MLIRNSKRNTQYKECRVPDMAIKSVYNNMVLPTINEGFNEIYYVYWINEVKHKLKNIQIERKINNFVISKINII